MLIVLMVGLTANAFAADNYQELDHKEKARLEKSRRDMAKRDKDGRRVREEARANRRNFGKSQEQTRREGKVPGSTRPGRALDIKG